MGVYLYTDTAYIPTANTLAYYPLNSSTTVNDKSWNSKNMTLSWTVTFGDYNWIDCAYFNGGYLYINESLVLWNDPRTISCWFNRQNTITEWGAFWWMWTASSQHWITSYVNWTWVIAWKYGYWNREYDWGFNETPIIWDWTLLTVTYDWTNIWVYLNGTYLWTPPIWTPSTTALTLNLTSWKTAIAQMPHFAAPAWKGYMSDFIFDWVCWSASEVADYYNNTKSEYGIS